MKRLECCKKYCRWTGVRSDLEEVHAEGAMFDHVCPRCGNKEFYNLPEPTKCERTTAVNDYIRFIADRGRRFFFEDEKYASMERDARGRVWLIDDYTRRRIYTHYQWEWKGFSHGGTLRRHIEALRDFITKGHQLNPHYYSPSQLTGGEHIWGYSNEDMAAIRNKGMALGIVAPLNKEAA